jgi:hypothetical protein
LQLLQFIRLTLANDVVVAIATWMSASGQLLPCPEHHVAAQVGTALRRAAGLVGENSVKNFELLPPFRKA